MKVKSKPMKYTRIENPSVLTLVNPGEPPRRSRKAKAKTKTGGSPMATSKKKRKTGKKAAATKTTRKAARKTTKPRKVSSKVSRPKLVTSAAPKPPAKKRRTRKARPAAVPFAPVASKPATRKGVRKGTRKGSRKGVGASDRAAASLAKALGETTKSVSQMARDVARTQASLAAAPKKRSTKKGRKAAAKTVAPKKSRKGARKHKPLTPEQRKRRATQKRYAPVKESIQRWKDRRGTKPEMPKWREHALPSMPTGRPPGNRERGHLALLDPWRPHVKGRSAPGWHWRPARKSGYVYKKNPKKGGAKKGVKKGGFLAGPRKGLSKVWRKLRFWKKNPKTGVADIAKYGAAGIGGYVGAGLVRSLLHGPASSLGGHPAISEGLSGLAGLVAIHFLAKSSDEFYAAAMAGGVVNVAQHVAESLGYDVSPGNLLSGAKGRISGLLGKGGGASKDGQLGDDLDVFEMALQGGPSDVELLEDLESEELGAWDGSYNVALSDDELVNEAIMSELEGYTDDLSDFDEDMAAGGLFPDDDELGATVDDVIGMAAMSDYVQVPEGMSDDEDGFEEALDGLVPTEVGLNDIDSSAGMSDYVQVPAGMSDYVAVPESMGAVDRFAVGQRGFARVRPRPGSGRRVAPKAVIRAQVPQLRAAIEQAVARTPGTPGTREHFLAVVHTAKASLGIQGPMQANWKRATLVAYRAATAGPRAAVRAAVASGAPVPAAVRAAADVKVVRVQPGVPAISALPEVPTNLERIIERAPGRESGDELDLLETGGGIFGGASGIFGGNILE